MPFGLIPTPSLILVPSSRVNTPSEYLTFGPDDPNTFPSHEGFVFQINLQPAGQPIYSVGITPGLPLPKGSSLVATITPATVPTS